MDSQMGFFGEGEMATLDRLAVQMQANWKCLVNGTNIRRKLNVGGFLLKALFG